MPGGPVCLSTLTRVPPPGLSWDWHHARAVFAHLGKPSWANSPSGWEEAVPQPAWEHCGGGGGAAPSFEWLLNLAQGGPAATCLPKAWLEEVGAEQPPQVTPQWGS